MIGGWSRRLAAALAAGALAVLASTAAAGAVETAQFGLDPGPGGSPRRHLVETVRAGHTTSDTVTLRNKTAAPLTLQLTVLPATVGPDGAPHVGGDTRVAGWVEVDHDQVRLAPNATAVVGFKVHAPRRLPAGRATAAIAAQPLTAGVNDVAVIQRLALVVTIVPKDGSSLTAPLGPIAWVALALVVLVAAMAAWRARRRRPQVTKASALEQPPAASATSAPGPGS